MYQHLIGMGQFQYLIAGFFLLVQWLVKKHGEEVLSVIKEVCCDLGLPLDSVEKPVVVDSQKLPNAPNEGYEVKATPAKIEAWRMWQELGMPMSKIAVSVLCAKHLFYLYFRITGITGDKSAVCFCRIYLIGQNQLRRKPLQIISSSVVDQDISWTGKDFVVKLDLIKL